MTARPDSDAHSAAAHDDGVVLCVGEALIALTPTDASLRTAAELAVSPAGAELNVAIHFARLGVRSRFAGRVGDDPLGQRLRDAVRAEGVDDSFLEMDPELPTGLYVKDPSPAGTTVLYYRRGSAATRMRALPSAAFENVDLVHLSGITPALSPDCDALVAELLGRTELRTSFDVNHRPALWDAEQAAPRLLELAAHAGTVFVGLDEAARLWDVTSAADVRVLLSNVPELVVKDGAVAATAFTAQGTTIEPALPVQVIEPVGAGDAFAAGYLASRRRGEPVGPSLRHGHALAAQVLASHSDIGLPQRGGAPATLDT